MQHMLFPLLNNMEAAAAASGQQSMSNKRQQQVMRTVSISVLVMSLPVLYVSFLHVPPAALFRDTTFWFLMSNSIIIVIAADSGMLFFSSSSSSSSSSDDDVDGGLSSFAAAVVKADDGRHAVKADDGRHAPLSKEQQQHTLVVRPEHGELALAAAIADDAESDRAYALVDPAVVTTPETREIVVVSHPSAANVDAGAIIVPATAAASRSLAEREERWVTRRRRRHRPSHSHSQALVPVQDKSVVVVSEEKERRHLRRAATTTTDRLPPPPPPPEMEEMVDEKESEYSRLSDEELNRRVEEFIARFNREIRLQLEKEEQAAAA